VDKELFGDTFRSPPRLTPLEARAIRLALEVVGPMIAADAQTPLERVRRKLEETFGEFDLAQTPEPSTGQAEEGLIATLTRGLRERRLVEIEYLKETEETPEAHLVEPHEIERRLPHWYVHTWDRTRAAERSFRLDRMRTARLTRERFTPREGFSHREGFARVARVWYSSTVARWQVERGATPLVDGSALGDSALGSPEWFVSWILSFRGEAVVLEPDDLRRSVGVRARELLRELGLVRLRVHA
jgi:predicted DNA-binding transcriptional regulator YafY